MVDIFQEETLPTKEDLSDLKKISLNKDYNYTKYSQNYTNKAKFRNFFLVYKIS